MSSRATSCLIPFFLSDSNHVGAIPGNTRWLSVHLRPLAVQISDWDEHFGPVLDWRASQSHSAIFTLDQVADQIALSLRTFQRRFRHLTGQAPLAWVNHQRINKARAILETTDLSIEQVADRSGLGSAANLRKHFKRVLGTTPRAYRSAFNST
jgi:transcriptional regulator GlxA family with amidase domain